MGRHGAPVGGRELPRIVHQVEQGLVDLADVVEERHALDAVALMLLQPGRLGQHQREARDAAHVRAGLRIGRVDGVEQRLEQRGGEALRLAARASLARDERGRAGGAGRVRQHGKNSGHLVIRGWRRAVIGASLSARRTPVASGGAEHSGGLDQ